MAVIIHLQALYRFVFLFFSCIYLVLELLAHRVVVCNFLYVTNWLYEFTVLPMVWPGFHFLASELVPIYFVVIVSSSGTILVDMTRGMLQI